VETVSVVPRLDVGRVEAVLVGVRRAELGRDEGVLARLVPEVVVEGRRVAAVLPAAFELEGLCIEDGEAAGAVPVGVAEHRDDDVVAGHAVHGVGSRVSRRANDLVRLDHLLDPWPPRVAGHVDDVDAGGAKARDDQVRAVGAVAGRAAAVPAEVVQLVTRVRHRQLMDDPSLLCVHHRDEVGCVGARVAQAGEVEELLRGRLHRLARRAVEGSGRGVLRGHVSSFQKAAVLWRRRGFPSSSRGAISAAARAAPSASTGR
jgi:hypothetical protein